jgi:hypothetical protein
MPITLTVRDENVGGGVENELSIDVLTERVTARELIRSRVYQEVQDYNLRQQAGPFRGLVRPEAERALNGPQGPGKGRPIDWKAQFDRAVEAFERGQVILLVDDRQAESLDEEFTVRPGSALTFLRLTLLVGG